VNNVSDSCTIQCYIFDESTGIRIKNNKITSEERVNEKLASTNSRELEYKRIAKALQIPSEDVEMWVIDVIRAGLIEGKLSQQKQVFLVHRTTYRVFGEKQWREVATRLDQWKASLRAVKEVISRERQQAEAQKEREMQEAERKSAGAAGMSSGRRTVGGGRDMVEMGTD